MLSDSNKLKLRREDEVEFLELFFPSTDTGAVQGLFSTRNGGVSSAPYSSLNLAFHVGDSMENVLENRCRFFSAVGLDIKCSISAKHVHGSNIKVVTEGDRGKGAFKYKTALDDTDALITDNSEVVLAAYFADCVPVYIFDPVKNAAGLVHAGWKGTSLGIAGKTLCTMKNVFGSKAENCSACIGPSIGPCCYKVDYNVIGSFEFPLEKEEGLCEKASHDKWLLNLWDINRKNLIKNGMKQENINVVRLCTSCESSLFFSHRREGLTGRMAALMKIGSR